VSGSFFIAKIKAAISMQQRLNQFIRKRVSRMSARILDGKAISQQIESELKAKIQQLASAHPNSIPCLAAVLVGDDPASQVYVRNKQKACERVGIASQLHRLEAATTTSQLLELILRLNHDPAVHGILVQLPLPRHISEQAVLDAVSPLKDVDCFHPENAGLMSQGRARFLPCTPHGVLQILHRSGISVSGKHAVVLGRSEIVGKPMAMLLAAKHSPLGSAAANATVTICHSRTEHLPSITRQADILIVAIGVAKFVGAEMVQPGAVVIDVGINRSESGLCGDVDFEAVRPICSAITPVPGGAGPLTISMLLENTVTAYQRQVSK
jgi:methylenetetrahydrofolate dehydrogenase (NADP+) / methenyltetrahydrofolate cyclohydrolase